MSDPVGALDVIPLVAHVDQNKTDLIKRVLLANTADALSDYEADAPTVQIYASMFDANDQPEGEMRCHQGFYSLFHVDYVCDVADLNAVTAEVRKIVFPYSFGEMFGDIAFAFPPRAGGVSGGVLDMKGKYVHWQDRFQVLHHTP
ncbi:MAG: hypothetical protein AAF358_13740 [Pseudomonadota bacterium]